jgi:hypothetical protein
MAPPDRSAAFSTGGPESGGGDLLLVARPGGYRHRGLDISSKVGGLGELGLEEGFRMAPADLEARGLRDGDPVSVLPGKGGPPAVGPAKSDPECPPGVVYFTRPSVFGGLEHRRPMASLHRLAANPVRVSVAAAGRP